MRWARNLYRLATSNPLTSEGSDLCILLLPSAGGVMLMASDAVAGVEAKSPREMREFVISCVLSSRTQLDRAFWHRGLPRKSCLPTARKKNVARCNPFGNFATIVIAERRPSEKFARQFLSPIHSTRTLKIEAFQIILGQKIFLTLGQKR